MIIVPMPTSPTAASEIPWKLKQPSQSNRGWKGKRRTTILPEAARWSAEVDMPVIRGEASFRPWRSFLAQLQGRANAFKLVAVEGPQFKFHQVVVIDGTGQKGGTLKTRGWQPGARLLDGMFITAGDRLLQVIGDHPIVGADGKLTVTVLPTIPEGLADGAHVEVRLPYALMSLDTDEQGWTVGVGQQYKVSFPVVEAL
ncbi:hypothetical protein [Sphingomonas parapaucimobilis]|uniref:Uncharacterized protein n=1 Tax=Sphingomonas parapaucimobilis NBRC 15100 TaxID=1219049 RepID=A0A0A1W6M2_9SPHN|nr:hypothetical protein [Sphingomonas parapaucimobilis]GAM00569.1 hypothetical protein SP5_034_01440 [Sphingomonas parapaucimobilis NBRC 15100]